MTTDTKAVARWDTGPQAAMWRNDADGDYVYFDDHEQVVAELTKAHKDNLDSWLHQREEIAFLRSALAAKSAEVEGLAKDAGRYRWLRGDGLAYIKFEGLTTETCDVGLDYAISAAMENSNEHQDQ